MSRADFLYDRFLKAFRMEPTSCQEGFFRSLADFITCGDADILVVNGYAGTGKTTAVSAVISALSDVGVNSVLMAPTGRSAKVLSSVANRPASTIHKQIYRQKSVDAGGIGSFSLAPNRSRNALFVVDEVSLIGSETGETLSGGALFGSGNLLADLVDYLRDGDDCRMIMIGDCAQLPPVGLEESPALSPSFMDAFGGVRYCSMSTVVRQSAESGILRNATMLRKLLQTSSLQVFNPGHLRLDIRDTCDVARLSGGELIDALSEAYDKYGEDGTVVLCRSNKRAIRYNLGIRARVLYKEEELLRGDRVMIVRNCYQFLEDIPELDYIANGDIAKLVRIRNYEERYGLRFADATLSFPDYGDVEVDAKVCLDTLRSESASLPPELQNALYEGVSADYADRKTRRRIWQAVREDKYYNALQLKYAQAITCHKAQGGQWDCVFIDCPFWLPEQSADDIKWLYTALTRAVRQVYLVNFSDSFFE